MGSEDIDDLLSADCDLTDEELGRLYDQGPDM